MLRNFLIGATRTGMTIVLGWIVAWLADKGFDLSAGTQTEVLAAAMAVVYVAIAALEKKWPKVGWLLGWGKGGGASFAPLREPDVSTKQGFSEPSPN